MTATRLTAAALLAAIVLSPYYVYANESKMSTEAMFITSDTDRSGSISRDEFSDYLDKSSDVGRLHLDFSMMDLNKDEKLTLEEMQVGEDMYPLAFN